MSKKYGIKDLRWSAWLSVAKILLPVIEAVTALCSAEVASWSLKAEKSRGLRRIEGGPTWNTSSITGATILLSGGVRGTLCCGCYERRDLWRALVQAEQLDLGKSSTDDTV